MRTSGGASSPATMSTPPTPPWPVLLLEAGMPPPAPPAPPAPVEGVVGSFVAEQPLAIPAPARPETTKIKTIGCTARRVRIAVLNRRRRTLHRRSYRITG